MTTLLVVGGGKMGEALVGGLLAGGFAEAADVVVAEPHEARRAELAERFPGLVLVPAVDHLHDAVPTDAIVAVKPQQVAEVCRALGAAGVHRILSIAAGVRLAAMEAAVPEGTAVVRAMPNTPAMVGAGASAIAGGAGATDADLGWAEQVLGAVGTVVRVTESQLDAVTGLSGSGPAYVFLVAEALIDAGVLVGLTRPVATDLAVQTLRGAAELLATGTPAAELRANVTSPGGTTAAGLRALEAAGVRAAFTDAVVAATTRSTELG
jgi:pyrroline-5-carboxylate reductase